MSINGSVFQSTKFRFKNRMRGFPSTALSNNSGLDQITTAWIQGITSSGGTLNDNSIRIAENFVREIKKETFYSKIMWLAPFLGSDIISARMPLIDVLSLGIMTNTGATNFTNSDFSESSGLQGGGTKRLGTGMIGTNLDSPTSNGGLGYWENNAPSTAGGSVIGSRQSNNQIIYVITSRNYTTSTCNFYWGAGSSNTIYSTSAGNASNGHWYGQSSSTTDRRIYKNGSRVANATNSESRPGLGDRQIEIMGTSANSFNEYHSGRCAVAYLTKGNLTDEEAISMHNFLTNNLIVPTGR